jgi:glycerate 2-kinase
VTAPEVDWLIAPDAFKGTYSAREVAEALARGTGGKVDLCPLADGGEGTIEAVLDVLDGHTRSIAPLATTRRSCRGGVGAGHDRLR